MKNLLILLILVALAAGSSAQIANAPRVAFLEVKRTHQDIRKRADELQRKLGDELALLSMLSTQLAGMRVGLAKMCADAGKTFEEEPTPTCK